MSVPNLHDSDDHIKTLMATKEYNVIWKKIATMDRHTHGESFWQEVEAVFNNCYTQLFMVGDSHDDVTGIDEARAAFDYVVGLDDDKVHYNYSQSTKADGLKKGHHAKDNRHGFTTHTACHSETADTLNVYFQRTEGMVWLTTERMSTTMFGKHTDKAGRLNNIELAMDWGYWEAGLLFGLLDKGANIHGTIKRQDWVPLTFDRQNTVETQFPKKPKDVPKIGFKDSFHMELKWKGGKQTAVRKVACLAYRSGTGTAVAIAISSRYRRIHWDLVPATSAGQRWYHDKSLSLEEKQKKAMVLLAGTDPDGKCADLILASMEPRTCSQGTADWFLDRQYSATSSTIAEMVVAVAPLISMDDDIYDSFQMVLEYAGFTDILGSALGTATAADEEAATTGNDGSDSEEQNAEEEDDDKTQAKEWVQTLTDEAVDRDAEFKAQVDDNDIEKGVLCWMVAILKEKDYKEMTANACMKTFDKDFFPHEKKRRRYEMLGVVQLRKKAEARGIKTTRMKKEVIIAALLMPDSEIRERQQQEAATTNAKRKKAVSMEDIAPKDVPLVMLVLKQSFLCPESKGPRVAAAIGHRNEEPFLNACFGECNKSGDDDNPDSFATLAPVAIYRVGLMKKKGSNFAKASLDGVTFVKTDDGDLKLIPTEVKSRVSPSTMSEARDRIEGMVGVEDVSPDKKFLMKVSSSDGLLCGLLHDESNGKRAKQESFQLLHGVHVSGADRGLLLVGSKDSLMYGIDVAFEVELLQAYQKVIDYIYEQYAKMFYESTVEELMENKDITAALDAFDYLDEHSFWTSYMLWRALNVNVNPRNIWHPLPPCARCLPFQHAYWNILKGKLYLWARCFASDCRLTSPQLLSSLLGPSDTTTKLLDNCEEHLGIRTPRTIATSRLVLVGGVGFHRSVQNLTSKASTEYATLFNFRNAANSCYSFGASLSLLIKHATADHERLQSAVAPEPSAAAVVGPNQLPNRIKASNTPPRRATRGGAEDAPKQVSWGFTLNHGCTPKKGRALNPEHQLREKNCDGRVLVAVAEDPDGSGSAVRNRCRVCGIKTAHYCTGCKNYLCFGNAQGLSKKRVDAIMKKDTNNLISERPKVLIKMDVFDPFKKVCLSTFAKNCCYLEQHKIAFDTLWQSKMNDTFDDADEEEGDDADDIS